MGLETVKIIVMRLGTSDFGKIGTYNVQEVGLANALIKKGHEVTVLYLNRPVSEVTQDESYPFVYYVPSKHIGLHGIFNVELMSRFSPESIILFSDNQLWAKNVINWGRKNEVKVVHYFGNVLSDNPQWLHQFYTKLILKRNIGSYHHSVNVAKTNKVKNEMTRLQVPCAGVIRVGLDDGILQKEKNKDLATRRALNVADDETVILFVGRLVDYKKPLLACDILKAFQERGNKASLYVIGKGPLEETLQDYVKEQGLEESVHYIGRVNYEEMYKYFVACDCLINLSPKEIFGMTILEAMYYGLPVIAHVAPGPNDIIRDGENGLLVDSEDVSVWIEKIQEALEKKEALAHNSIADITENYLWDQIADQFLAFI